MSPDDRSDAEYRCPGEPYRVSREVHWGRLARFYPGCRQCQHRDDTGPLSARQVRQLAEVQARGQRQPLFDDEGAGGVWPNDLGPDDVERLAAAMGAWLRRQNESVSSAPSPQPSPGGRGGPLVVAVAGDGRPAVAEAVAAAIEGLRWTGCHVVDIGPATAPCLAFAVQHLPAAGGVLLGNPGRTPQIVHLKFWTPEPCQGQRLAPLRTLYERGVDRPTRTYGALRRFQADVPYLATLEPHYHALRPLRFVLDAASAPLVAYFQRLSQSVACRAIPCHATPDRLAAEVAAAEAHFAFMTDGNGESWSVLDEQGRAVAPQRVMALIAKEMPRDALGVLTGLLVALSQSDRRLSRVLDERDAVE